MLVIFEKLKTTVGGWVKTTNFLLLRQFFHLWKIN